MIGKIRENFQSADDVRLFLRIAMLVVWVRMSLLFTTPMKLVETMDTDLNMTPPVPGERAAKFTDFFNKLRGRRGPGKCLVRSLVLFRLLHETGLPVEINFGLDNAKKPTSGLDGHSWISLNGRPILEARDPNERFAVFYHYGPTQAKSGHGVSTK